MSPEEVTGRVSKRLLAGESTMNAAEKKDIAVFKIENGAYMIQTGHKVTIIKFT
jgi:hypothetical protein